MNPQYSKDLMLEAAQEGYSVVFTDLDMFKAVALGAKKLLDLFSDAGMTPEYLRPISTTEPRLSEMTAAALEIREKERDGFFLMVEGSQVDWANHANNYPYQLMDMLAFDEAVKVVLDWIDEKPARKKSTLLIVVADHETGGFAINGPQTKMAQKGCLPGDQNCIAIKPAWTLGEHTGVDTLIWSQDPGRSDLAKPLDNTDLYYVMIKAMGLMTE